MPATILNRDQRMIATLSKNGGLALRLLGILILLLLTIVAVCNLVRVTRVGAGYVGIEINLAGSQRGAQEIPIRTGWVFYSPLKTQIVEFPTFVENVKWTADVNEGHPANEEIVFNSREGQEVRADVSLSYAIRSVNVPEFYVKYRTDDLEKFTHGILKDIVRNSLNEMASTYTLEDIYGENKARFLTETRKRIQAQVEPVGVEIQQFGFIGKPRFTTTIEQAITQKTQAITDAERARNQLAVTQAEVAKAVAAAEGEARSAIERARGEAESNRLRQASITPQLLEWKRLENQRALIDRWNGELPRTVMSDKAGLIMPLPAETR
ncbi:MAG: SPFH domain-containing protein [Acidobacteria bacterium]|nr:SPFH domain-containing protein [Acidobacteriota bacterium]MBV9622762.1 SPFH domain-containing protein [Acidobacteriota bacterium]